VFICGLLDDACVFSLDIFAFVTNIATYVKCAITLRSVTFERARWSDFGSMGVNNRRMVREDLYIPQATRIYSFI
jgi:hypothetical protein